ncbi:MAG: PTS sugar transporter subunit IIA [Nitrospirae bacterium]|nr:PTS sugar transporter subunit IIA [Nitrospirota bacterium]
MNMSVKDVAELLNVSEKTIYRMIQNETIPCFRVGGQWRFDRREITSWLEDTRAFSWKTTIDNASFEDEESISIAEFLKRGGIYFKLPGKTKNAAIAACLERIKTGIPQIGTQIDIKWLYDSIVQRETLCSTAVGNGIALPHPKSFGKFTESSYIALCFLEKLIPFAALDNEDVDTLFFIFPKSETRFLRIQSKLLRLLRDEEVLSVVKKTPSADNVSGVYDIYELFSRKEAEIFKVVGKEAGSAAAKESEKAVGKESGKLSGKETAKESGRAAGK